jgi:uncharacterized protein (TIGR03437 family)
LHFYITLRQAGKYLLLIGLAAVIGWTGRSRAESAQVRQLASSHEALLTARQTLERARAERKSNHTEDAARTIEKALASYNAALAARTDWISARLKELVLDPSAQTESEELRAELQSLAPDAGAPLGPTAALVPEVEPNDTPAQAMQLDLSTSAAILLGAVAPIGDRDHFKFTVPAGAKVWAYVDTGGTTNAGATSRNSVLTLIGTDGTTVIEEDDDDGTGNGCDGTQETFLASAIAGRTLTAGGTYYLRVQSGDNGVINPYTLYVVVTAAAPTAEVEPNNTPQQATPAIAAGETIGLRSGMISPAGDVDVYSVAANANDILYISNDDDPERDGTGTDTVVELLSPSGNVLLLIDNSDDLGFPAPPAEAACFAVSTAGTYFVRVRHFTTAGTGTYHLMVAVAGQRQTDCAAVTGINPSSGGPGTSITITGTNLTGVIGVTFPNNVAAPFTVINDTQINTIVPVGAVSGQIQLSKPNCPTVGTPFFIVPGANCPAVTGLNPVSGVAGTRVAITGNNFTGVSAVRFANNVAATFTIASNNLITATVPAGAATGPITIVRSDCAAVQTASFTVNTGPLLELAVDDGTFETSIELFAGGTDYAVNRLTPASYPATLSRVAIFFTSNGSGLQVGATVRIIVGVNPGGGANIDNTQFQVAQATVQALNQFNVYAVPAVTISSGDFVVGFSIINQTGVFPAAVDRTPPSQMRSYLSSNGTTFMPLDSIGGGALAGNFGIRALLDSTVGTLGNVSAASFLGAELARDSIVAVFGANLATTIQSATSTPLPTALAGTTVKVRDSTGTERLAPLFFVAPGQVNYLMPTGTATGAATVTITSGDGSVSSGTMQIAAVAPGLFAANANGMGVAAAVVLRRNAAGQDTFEPVARLEGTSLVAVPIDLGPATDQVFLILYGTGIRGHSALSMVTAQVGGVDVPVLFAGDQGTFAGLDQVNLGPLPRSLVGRGDVVVMLTVDGKAANNILVSIR